MSNLTLKKFLKLYTAIPNKFINEYCDFYDMCQNNKFGIDINLVVEYLEITDKNSFYKRLKNNFILDSDYIITKLNLKLQKGQQDTFYYISFETFEKLCMYSSSERENNLEIILLC